MSLLGAPPHIYKGVKPVQTPWQLDMWQLEPSLGSLQEASLQKGRSVATPSGRQTSGVADQWAQPLAIDFV